MQKVLIIIPTLDIGGIETSLMYLVNNLDKNKYIIDLLVHKDGELLSKIDLNGKVLYYDNFIKYKKGIFYRLNKNIMISSLYRKYKNAFRSLDSKYDVIISYNGFDNYFDMIGSSISSKKKIIWVHNDYPSMIKNKRFAFLYKIMYKLMGKKFTYFDKIICVSQNVKNNFDNFYPQYKDKTQVIYNYIDSEMISKKSLEKSDVKLTGKFNIIAVGRLTKSKGFAETINVVKPLIAKYNDVKLYILGDGEEKDNLQFMINNYGLNNSVILLGKKLNPYNILKQADLLVSMSKYESFGNILLEAVALNVPFLTTSNSGAKDICEILLKDKSLIVNSDNMYEEIKKIIDNKKHNNTRFDFNVYNKNIKDEINKLLDNK